MGIRSGFFNSVAGDRKYNAGRFAEYFSSFIGNGVFPEPANGLQILSNDDMTLTVKAGKAWIDGYIFINDDDYILTISPASGVLNRIDRAVLRFDTVDREIRLEVKKGAEESSPVAPTLQRDTDAYELCLANVKVDAGTIKILQTHITDMRKDINLCGTVSTVIKADLPSGMVTMWAGLVANIPVGWALCNGTNGTPNLTDRFVMGAVTDATINKTGGQNEVTLTEAQMPAHNHTGSAVAAGLHSHRMSGGTSSSTYPFARAGGSNGDILGPNTDTAGSHTHTLTINDNGSGQAHENRPAYYTLAFIMKV